MDLYPYLWLAWALALAVAETTGLALKTTPTARTVRAHLAWVAAGAGVWHWTTRTVLAALAVWMPLHFGLPGTDWASVWPNIIASVLWSAWAAPTAIAALGRHHRALKDHQAQGMADLKAHLTAHLEQHHTRLLNQIAERTGQPDQ